MKLWRPSRAGVTEFERTTEPDPLRHICKLVALGNHPLGTVGYDCMVQPQRASQPPAGILSLSDPQYHAVAPCAGVQRECLPSFEAVAECGRMGGQLAKPDPLYAIWNNKLAVEAERQEDSRYWIRIVRVLRSTTVLDRTWNGRCQRCVVQHAGNFSWLVYCKTTCKRVI